MKKRNLGAIVIMAVVMTSCGVSKPTVVESQVEKKTSLEGDKVQVETAKLQGIEMVDDLGEDGLSIVKVAYKWYSGIGKANDKQTAIESAEREARATISRIVEAMVLDQAQRGSVANNGEVQKAINSHWQQVSRSLQKACEPFGDTKIEYNSSNRMYTATVKVGIRGDRFQQMMNNAGDFKPSTLSGKDLDNFIEVNKTIIDAAKGK